MEFNINIDFKINYIDSKKIKLIKELNDLFLNEIYNKKSGLLV